MPELKRVPLGFEEGATENPFWGFCVGQRGLREGGLVQPVQWARHQRAWGGIPGASESASNRTREREGEGRQGGGRPRATHRL